MTACVCLLALAKFGKSAGQLGSQTASSPNPSHLQHTSLQAADMLVHCCLCDLLSLAEFGKSGVS